MENNPAISIPEWNSLITNSAKRLYDSLVAAYGSEYYIAVPYLFTSTNSLYYDMPDGTSNYLNANGTTAQKYYKLSGVDLQYSAAPNGWITLKRFEWIERNKFTLQTNATNYLGQTNLKYCTRGKGLYFNSIPNTGMQIRAWYVPAPTSMQFLVVGAQVAATNTIVLSDVTNITVGMSVFGTGVAANTTIITVTPSTNTLTLSTNTTATIPFNTFAIWSDATTFDGIAGWEEFVIIDSAIKAQIKQENEVQELVEERNLIIENIQAMAEGRDIGQAIHVSDALSLNGYGFGGDGDDGYGGTGFGGGW